MWSFFSKDPAKELVNFEIQEPVQLNAELQERTIWNLSNAKKKGASAAPLPANDSLYSVFSYQVKQGNEHWMPAAKNAFRRTKMLRHPNILMFQDGIENDKSVFIVTERVQPLYNYLRESQESQSQRENEISWGLYQIATALNFLNNDCKLVHNNVCMASIVVTRSGDWKLTGFDFCHAIDEQNVPTKVLHTLDVYNPPERSPVANYKSPQSNRTNVIPTESAIDSWGIGCLIWEIFNSGLLPNANSLQNIGSSIPKRLVGAYQNLLNSQPNKRLSPAKFISTCKQDTGFMSNHFVDTLLFLEEIQIKDQNEKTKFFTELTEKLDDFPGQLCKFKILPQLLNAYEFGNAGSSVLPPLFKLGKSLEESEYQKKIIPIVVKLFSSTDRTTRMRLLQQLHLFVEHLSASTINDQLFPNICQGFLDTNPAIREATIRSIVLIAPKLNYNNMNVELMKHFARLQGTDDQGMIRTNTTVCIGKIAPFINPQLRQRILLSAFPKALRDPFPLARLSGVVALANTDRFYTLKDVAGKVLPSLSLACIDPEKDVRDEAFKTIKTFLQKLEKVSESPELALEMEKDVSACNLDVKNETSWTSWAMTSLSAKMSGYKNKNQQPSVALNTQPLGPPPSLNVNVSGGSTATGTGSEKPSPKQQPSQSQTNRKPEQDTSRTNQTSGNKEPNSNASAGWNMEESEWRDLEDDDDQMEPFEPLETTNFSFKPAANKNSGLLTTTSSKQSSNEFTSWTNSFEDDKNQLPPASSYNWSTTSTDNSRSKNEEDIFSSLISDVSLKSKPATQPKQQVSPNPSTSKPSGNQQTSGFNDWSSDWSNDWDNSNAKESKIGQKKQQADTNPKQSKPLKLGQKKDPPF